MISGAYEIGLLVLGIGLLWKGAGWVVSSACRVATRFDLADAVVGATLVAIGTSAPEMAVTLVAAWRGKPGISVGNVIGSDIFNLGLILGGCATVWAIPTTRQMVKRDAPLLLLATILLLFLLHDGHLQKYEGLAMMVCLGSYVLYLLRHGGIPIEEPQPCGEPATGRDYFTLLLGLAAVISGANLLVDSAAELAQRMGLSEWAIGITIVAGGTSLPELATAAVAAHRGRVGLMAGTLIGSDIFNVLGVLGLAAFLHPLEFGHEESRAIMQSLGLMAGMLCVLILFMRTGWQLTRTEGVALIAMALARWTLGT